MATQTLAAKVKEELDSDGRTILMHGISHDRVTVNHFRYDGFLKEEKMHILRNLLGVLPLEDIDLAIRWEERWVKEKYEFPFEVDGWEKKINRLTIEATRKTGQRRRVGQS